MKRLFCWLTGGHKYNDANLTCAYDSFIGAFVRNRCVKCGKEYIGLIDLKAILEKDMEEYAERHSLDVRKDGADNG